MKTITKIIFSIMFFSLFLSSCNKKEDTFSKNDFAIKDLNGDVVKSLPSDLLMAIKTDLIQKGRHDDAKILTNLYDFNTGILKGISIDEIEYPTDLPVSQQVSDSLSQPDSVLLSNLKSQYEPNGIYAYCHIAGYGDMGPFTQANYLGADIPYPYAGTVGQKRRLEGLWLQTESSLLLTRPTVYYALCFYNGVWSNTATWGQFTGTRGQSKTTSILKIWTTNSGYSIWYKAHTEGTGWNQPWHNDGQPAGIAGKRLEAFAFHILVY